MDALAQLNAAVAGRYLVEREIGAGGMATVYLARDTRHDRRVALKVLNAELGAVLGVERFLSEIRVTANLQHPNLLPLFDSGEAGGLLFYVMPFVEGETLRARLHREKQLSIDEALHIATAIASALDYAHTHGVIHRDLKPENILLQAGQPVVADFGIALAVTRAGGARITQTGLSLGTPQYMSPEQATGDRVVDGRTDIYSLGAITYEMLAGEPPHVGPTAQAIIAKLLTDDVRPLTRLRRTVPAHVDLAVRKALEKLPADRFATGHDFAEALHGRGVSIVSTPIGDGVTRWEPARTKHWLLDGIARITWSRALTAGALLVAAATSIGWWIAARRESHRPTVRFALSLPAGFRMGVLIAGQGRTLAVSPDGQTIAYVGVGAGKVQSIYLRDLNALQGHEVSGTEGAVSPFFSPDGKWIGFFASGQLRKVSAAGGPVIPLTETLRGLTFGASWASKERIVIAFGDGLAVVPASGGAPRLIAGIDSINARLPRWPRVLPDGETILYTSWTTTSTSSRIAVTSIDGARPTVLDLSGVSPLAVMDGNLIYASGATGALMAVPFDVKRRRLLGNPQVVVERAVVSGAGAAQADISPNGTLVYQSGTSAIQLVLVDNRGAVQTLVPDGRPYTGARFSPNGRRIATSVGSGTSTDIWIYDVSSRTSSRLTTEGETNDRPEWTPDGRRVLFRSDRGKGGYTMWWQPIDGSGPPTPIASVQGRDVWEGVISPDGRSIVYRTGTIGTADILVKQLQGDTTPKPIVSEPGTQWGPRVSPDGRWLAYTSDESGSFQIYVRPFAGPGGARLQVSSDGGDIAVWAPDSRRLFYAQGQTIYSVTLSTSPELAIASRAALFDGDFTLLPGHATYDVAPDGKHLLMLKPIGDDAQTIVAYNWRDELRSRTQGQQR